MGWVLWPSGIGWKQRGRTVSTGVFDCPNARCKSKASGQPPEYRVRQYRNWVVVLYVPVLPLNTLGANVQCTKCKSFFSLEMLPRAERQIGSSIGTTGIPHLAADRRTSLRRACPSCNEQIACDATACSFCGHESEAWQFNDGAWRVKRGDRWYWLNTTSNQWDLLGQPDTTSSATAHSDTVTATLALAADSGAHTALARLEDLAEDAREVEDRERLHEIASAADVLARTPELEGTSFAEAAIRLRDDAVHNVTAFVGPAAKAVPASSDGGDHLTRWCPHCRSVMPREASICPDCKQDSTPWVLHSEVWWTKTEDGWYWLELEEREWFLYDPQRDLLPPPEEDIPTDEAARFAAGHQDSRLPPSDPAESSPEAGAEVQSETETMTTTARAEGTESEDDAVAILRQRLARGEINVDTYRQLLTALRDT